MALALEAIDWGTADHWMRMQAAYELAQARRQGEHVHGAPDGRVRGSSTTSCGGCARCSGVVSRGTDRPLGAPCMKGAPPAPQRLLPEGAHLEGGVPLRARRGRGCRSDRLSLMIGGTRLMTSIDDARVRPMLNPPHLGELIRESIERSRLDGGRDDRSPELRARDAVQDAVPRAEPQGGSVCEDGLGAGHRLGHADHWMHSSKELGLQWRGSGAVDPETGMLYIPSCNQATVITLYEHGHVWARVCRSCATDALAPAPRLRDVHRADPRVRAKITS